jgi:hypothetical protein
VEAKTDAVSAECTARRGSSPPYLRKFRAKIVDIFKGWFFCALESWFTEKLRPSLAAVVGPARNGTTNKTTKLRITKSAAMRVNEGRKLFAVLISM